MDEDHGHYEKSGDVEEWKWDKGHAPKVEVPEGEFDPRDKPEPEPRQKVTEPREKKTATKETKK